MKWILVLLSVVSFSVTALAHSDGGHKKEKFTKGQTKFGGKITTTKVEKLNDIVTDFKKFEGKTVSFEAVPKKVCKKSGCWMVLKDGNKEVRTLFKDYGFFVPADIVGKKVRVQGVMEQKQISAATRRHFMKDEGAKARDIKKIVNSEIQYQFTADAVEII